MPISGNCFVIMPFKPELHYMYLYMKSHIEKHHNLKCEHGDSSYDQDGILEKVRKYITDADVIIGDCTQRNPNVMYELGMAYEMSKPVVLITSDEIEHTPTDIKSFEFIRYDLGEDTDFLKKLDGALHKIMGTYDELYEAAKQLFHQFREEKDLHIEEADKEEFVRTAATRARTSALPAADDHRAVAKKLMPAMATFWDIDTSDLAKDWIDEHFPA